MIITTREDFLNSDAVKEFTEALQKFYDATGFTSLSIEHYGGEKKCYGTRGEVFKTIKFADRFDMKFCVEYKGMLLNIDANLSTNNVEEY